MNITEQKVTTLKCNECGSDLIMVETTTYLIGNNLSPITKTSYRCSKTECQAEADKREAKRIELKKEQEEARENRRRANAAKFSATPKNS